MVDMIANRQLVGDYGRVEPHHIFRCSPEVASSLEARGLARRLHPEKTLITETVKAPKPGKSTVERIQAAVEKEVAPEPEPEKKPAKKKAKSRKRRKK